MSKKKNKNKQFKTFLKIYTGVLAIAIVVVCCIVWGKLKKYQNNYDKAKANGNPDKYVEQFIASLDYEKFSGFIDEYGLNNVDKEDTMLYKEHAIYYSNLVKTGTVTFSRNEKFKSALPIYDIKVGDTRLGVISLKAEGKNDDFGFHLWTLKEIVFDTDNLNYSDYKVVVPADALVYCNGEAIPGEAFTQDKSNDVMYQTAMDLGGVAKNAKSCKLKKMLNNPNVIVKDSEGKSIEGVTKDNVIDYTNTSTDSLKAETQSRIFETIRSYILTIYNKKSYDATSVYIQYGSPAHALVVDVLASTIWGWTPDTVDVLDEQVSDFISYGDNVFSCNYYGKIFKFGEGDEETGEEEFKYRLLFHKVDGQWYLYHFIILA